MVQGKILGDNYKDLEHSLFTTLGAGRANIVLPGQGVAFAGHDMLITRIRDDADHIRPSIEVANGRYWIQLRHSHVSRRHNAELHHWARRSAVRGVARRGAPVGACLPVDLAREPAARRTALPGRSGLTRFRGPPLLSRTALPL